MSECRCPLCDLAWFDNFVEVIKKHPRSYERSLWKKYVELESRKGGVEDDE